MRRYKVIITKKDLYKEVELNDSVTSISIGTTPECDVRLRRSSFFESFKLDVRKNSSNNKWTITCSDNLYVSTGDVRKLITKELSHGDLITIKYQKSDNDLFNIEFLVDFDYELSSFDKYIDLTNVNKLKIGGTNDSDIVIENEYAPNELLILNKNNNCFKILEQRSSYGIYVNGIKIEKEAILQNTDFFAISGVTFYLKDNKLYTDSTAIKFKNELKVFKTKNHSTHYQHPKFVRNTRVQYAIPEEELNVQQPVAKPQLQKKNIITSLIPSIVMIAMTIVLRGIMGGGGTFVIYSAVSMGIGAIMTVVSFIQDKKTFKEETEKRIESYNKYIADKEELIIASREKELRIRDLINESLDNSIEEVDAFGRRLFEKSSEDIDFLNVYLGKGLVESINPIKYDKQEFIDPDDPITLIPEQLHDKYQFIENAPIVAEFNESNAVGVTGESKYLQEMIKNITLDIAIKHFYGDVKFVFITNMKQVQNFEWIRWLHNVYNDELNVRNIACDDESYNLILEYLYNLLSIRDAQIHESKDIIFNEKYIVFVTDSTAIRTHPLTKYIPIASRLGFTFVFFEEYEENIPQGCAEIIRLNNEANGGILKTLDGESISNFNYKVIDNNKTNDIALKLSAICTDEVTLEGELTKNITLFELLNILSVDDINLEENWKNSAVYKSLAAPIGVKRKNEIVYLDISDKSNAHGPHGLVAGTTGSGKSEILQTYILSLTTLFHPYEVGFVIIDFKGGGMANQFKELPHLIGTITNIDGREIDRSLLSIKAELVKRQELFSKAGVNHINNYIKLYKAGKVTVPMPHLIMIVDEFAELKAEFPDFMKELISAARIGRTLGVHLILATQKPAGVVDAQIWSNSKFKLCLKVQTKEDSNEVLKTPLAAEIVEPGRAYFQVGNNEIFDLFQSAYSGASIPEGNDNKDKIFDIYEKNLWGKRELVYTNSKKGKGKNSQNQLQAIVEYVNHYCKVSNIKSLPGICLPPLKDRLSISELDYAKTENTIVVPIGVYDDPEQQVQKQVNIELSKDNIYIVGSSQSGKTVLLQTIVYGLISNYKPSQVNLYLVDCGSMVLRIFDSSSHVGGVVLSNEDEKCQNLFKMINSTIVERKQRMSELGIGNYAAYLEAGYTEMPLMVVIIDNMAAFKEYFPDQNDELNSITREAQSVGISFIITATTSNALNYRVQANFGQKLVLNCNDDSEYSNVFGHCRQTPKEIAGRGLLQLEKRILEFQVVVFGNSNKEADRSKEFKELVSTINSNTSEVAKKIPMVPEKLLLSEIFNIQISFFKNKQIIPIGMNYSDVQFEFLDFNISNSLSLVGNNLNSRTKFLVNLFKILSKTIIFHNMEIVLVDDKSGSLQEFSECGFVKEYTKDTFEGIGLVEDYCDEVLNDDEDDIDEVKQVLLINSQDIFRRIVADKTLSKKLASTIKTANEMNAFVILATVENQIVGFNASEVLKTLKEERSAILFAPIQDNKLFEISGRVKKDSNFDSSMGYYFTSDGHTRIKLFE